MSAPLSAAEVIDRLREVARSAPAVRVAFSFGSFATGRASERSDIDVAIVPAHDLSLRDELDLAVAFERACGRRVDLVRLDRASALVGREGCGSTWDPRSSARRSGFAGAWPNARCARDCAVVTRKLSSLGGQLSRLKRRRPDEWMELAHDVDRQDAIGLSLLVAVQEALDIALHIASDEVRAAQSHRPRLRQRRLRARVA